MGFKDAMPLFGRRIEDGLAGAGARSPALFQLDVKTRSGD